MASRGFQLESDQDGSPAFELEDGPGESAGFLLEDEPLVELSNSLPSKKRKVKPTNRSCQFNATTTTKDTAAAAEKSADDLERKLHDASLQGKILLELFCGVAAVAAGACGHAGIVGVGLDILGGFDLTRALAVVWSGHW